MSNMYLIARQQIITSKIITTQQLIDMEEGKKENDNAIIESNMEIIIDKNDMFGDNFKIPANNNRIWKKQPDYLCKCIKCYCDIEKCADFMDNQDMYYCSTCWDECPDYYSTSNTNIDSFIEKWGYEYEKVELV